MTDKNAIITDQRISKIYSDYFDLIDSYFGSIKKYLSPGKYGHEQLGREISSYPFVSDLVLDAVDDIGEDIHQFWGKVHDVIRTYLIQQESLKCLYSGDLSPVDIENFVKRSGLYVDTVIIPDPLLNIATFMKPAFADKKLYLDKLIRHVFNIVRLRDLILASANEKIVLLYPTNLQTLDEKTEAKILTDAESEYLKYVNELIGHKFTTKFEVIEHFKTYDTVADLFKTIRNVNVLPTAINTPHAFEVKMRGMFDISRKFSVPKHKNVTEAFATYALGQFARVQEHKLYCNLLVAEPIYDYELPWSFLNYDLGGQDIDPAIVNALQTSGFNWIGNVPLEALKILREEGQMDYMRAILRKGITSMQSRTDKDMTKTIAQLQENIREAFNQQKSETASLKKHVGNILKKDIPIEVGAFLVGFIPYIGNYLTLPAVAKSLYDKVQTIQATRKKLQASEKGAISLLLKSYGE